MSDPGIATKAERQRLWLEMASDPSGTPGHRGRAAWLLVRSGGALPDELQHLLTGPRSRGPSTRGNVIITIGVPIGRPVKRAPREGSAR
jgi:hypothetical protein